MMADTTTNIDDDCILLKTYGTSTYAYCKRRNLYIYIGVFDSDVEAKKRAIAAYINTNYDDNGTLEEEVKKVLPARPPTNTHGVVLWSTKTLEYGNKEDGTYRKSVYEGYISKASRNPHGRGTMWYFDGRIYEGEWYEGLHYGHGTLISSDGKTSWTGQFKNHTCTCFAAMLPSLEYMTALPGKICPGSAFDK